MKRALKIIGLTLAGALGLLLAALAALIVKPSLFLNTRTVSAAIRRFGKAERPAWKDLSFKIESRSPRVKRVVFDASDFCVDAEDGSVKGCFSRLTLDATVRLALSPSVTRLETLTVRSGPLRLDQTVSPAAAAKKKREPAGVNLALVPEPLRSMTLGTVDVDLPDARIKTSSGTTTLKLSAAYSEKVQKPLALELFAVVPTTAPGQTNRYQVTAALDSDLFRTGTITKLNATVRVRGAGTDAQLKAEVRQPRPDALSLAATASAQMSGRTLRAKLDGLYSADRAGATADVSVENPAGPVRVAALRNCRFDAPLGKSGPTAADLKCGVSVMPGKLGATQPKTLAGALAFHADFKRKGAQADHFTAALDLELGPEKKWYGFFAKLNVKLAGRTGSIPQSLTAKHEFHTGFTVEKFDGLVKALQGTDFAVPAPLNSMSGKAVFEAGTAGNTRGENQKIDYKFTTDLSSPKQRLKTEIRGALTIEGLFRSDRKIGDKTEVDLQDVALQLPYIKIGPIPSPVADTRIKTGDPKRDAAVDAKRADAVASSTASVVDYAVHIVTKKPVLLLTNLLKNPVPISLDLTAKPAVLSGTINLEPFELEAFKQKAQVDHITLTPGAANAPLGLDGKVVYKRQDVVVDILLLGSTEKPQVVFQSKPPLSQNEIVALLLYGKTPNELDSDQQASAGTASSAFTDGAFGLASLYLFASTPVDSVGYDAATQSYEVKFKLPGGVTMGVGSNLEESKTLTLRKRVARNVELETQLAQRTQSSQRSAVTTFLQWFRRY